MNHSALNCLALDPPNLANEAVSASADVLCPVSMTLVKRGETGRHELECYIRNRYQETHGANIRQFMPDLLALQDSSGSIVGALGYRSVSCYR